MNGKDGIDARPFPSCFKLYAKFCRLEEESLGSAVVGWKCGVFRWQSPAKHPTLSPR